jgi:AcrR family transcriptional regulator
MTNPVMPYDTRKAAVKGPSGAEQSIFATTEALLNTTPLSDLTVEEILQHAGVSRTTFYKKFASKYSVVSAMLKNLQAELVDIMRPWFADEQATPSAALRDAITAVAELWQRHRPILRASSENWHAEPEVGRPWTAMMARFVHDIAEKIDEERLRGIAPAGVDSTALARTLVWSSERMLYLAGFGLCGDHRELDVIDALVATWVGTIYQSAGQ